MPKIVEKPVLPLFEMYTIEQLIELTPYREEYLFRIKMWRTPLTAKFRDTVCKCLHRPESELFGTQYASSQS